MSSVNTGLSITRALELKGRSQKWLAMTIGMAPSAVSRMTRNRSAKLINIECICTALDMRVSEFIALGEKSDDKA
jgi:DNA-binding Xre family transcriptional regulator